MSLLSELRRRNVLRVGAAYIVTSWLIVQVADTVFPIIGIDESHARAVVIVLAAGLIPALVFAWFFEITPGGLLQEKFVDRSKSITSQTGKKLDRIIIVVLALSVAYFAVDKFLISADREAAIAESARKEGIAQALVTTTVAVLPFTNESGDRALEYLSKGFSDSLANRLSSYKALRVIGSTSASAFLALGEDFGEAHHRLGAGAVVHGSVSLSGNQIRVKAQLVDTSERRQVWTGTYSRLTTDIFRIQDDIAREVVSRLAQGSEEESETEEEPIAKTNIDAYSLYLRGMEVLRTVILRPEETPLKLAIDLFDQSIAIEPGYSNAYAARAHAFVKLMQLELRTRMAAKPENVSHAEQSIVKSLALNPLNALAYSAKGALEMSRTDTYGKEQQEVAEANLHRAIELNSSDALAYAYLASLYGDQKDYAKFLEIAKAGFRLDPLHPATNYTLGAALSFTGRKQEAVKYFRQFQDLSGLSIYGSTEGYHESPVDLDFEAENLVWDPSRRCNAFEVAKDRVQVFEGNRSLRALNADVGQCGVYLRFLARDFRGSYLKLTGYLKLIGEGSEAEVKVWVYNKNGHVNLGETIDFVGASDGDWTAFEVVGYVPPDADRIVLGPVVRGEVYADSFQIERLDEWQPSPPHFQ